MLNIENLSSFQGLCPQTQHIINHTIFQGSRHLEDKLKFKAENFWKGYKKSIVLRGSASEPPSTFEFLIKYLKTIIASELRTSNLHSVFIIIILIFPTVSSKWKFSRKFCIFLKFFDNFLYFKNVSVTFWKITQNFRAAHN